MALSFQSDNGKVWIDCSLQGRIFAEIDGQLLHKFDRSLAEHPSETEFNNIGGNSLWPGPEGGKFAFNYRGDEWYVQSGVNRVCPEEAAAADGHPEAVKRVVLVNRKKTEIPVVFRRRIDPVGLKEILTEYSLKGVAYRESDSIQLEKPADPEDAVICAWSLEQFSGCEGITAFGIASKGDARSMINADFYGDPWSRLSFSGQEFQFKLGGTDRLQIGLSSDAAPVLIGAYMPEKELVILRSTAFDPCGKYINIADNEQPEGVYSARDQYSIFNGAGLNFFELETLAPMVLRDGKVQGSSLASTTRFFQGPKESLFRMLAEKFNIHLS